MNSTISAGDTLTLEDVMLGVKDLASAEVPPFADGLYKMAVSSAAMTHMKTDVSNARLTFSEVTKYVPDGQKELTAGSVFRKKLSIMGVMFYETNHLSQTTVDIANVWNNLLVGRNGLGMLSMGDMEPDIQVRKPTSTDQPIPIFGTISFMFRAAPALLRAPAVEILYSAP